MLFTSIENYIKALPKKELTDERKAILGEIAQYMVQKLSQNETVNLNFICTHNSRRSQLAQIWAQTMAHYYGIKINGFSGGVEVTAFHPNAVSALKNVGFQISNEITDNPHYTIAFSDTNSPLIAFSKLYNNKANPKENFAAIMTCSEADDNCPFIPGAEARIPLRYEDPKIYDGTDKETSAYAESSEIIASEMNWLFNIVKNKI